MPSLEGVAFSICRQPIKREQREKSRETINQLKTAALVIRIKVKGSAVRSTKQLKEQ